MILALRTDKPEAELYLLDQIGQQLAHYTWPADRSLADQLLPAIKQFLKEVKLNFKDLTGITVFTGRGSFTGLRIGTTVANGLAYGLKIKVAKVSGEDWLNKSTPALKKTKLGQFIAPDYSAEPNITTPRV